MARQLNLDRDKLDQCYALAERIIAYAWKYIHRHSSHSMERGIGHFLNGHLHHLQGWAPPKNAAQLQGVLGLYLREEKARRLRNQALDGLKKGEGLSLLHFDFSKKWEEKWRPEDYQLAWDVSEPARAIPRLEGLTLPEQTLLALQKNFSIVQFGAWLPVLSRQIEAHRALVDLSFSLVCCAKTRRRVLTPAFAGKPPDILVHHLLFEQLARQCGLEFENVVLWAEEDSAPKDFWGKAAWFQLLREVFSQSAIWLKFSERPHPYTVWAAAFAEWDGIFFDKEETLRPIQGEYSSLRGIGKEFVLDTYGRIARSAQQILDQGWRDLKKIQTLSLWRFLEDKDEPGKGREGLSQKPWG